MDNLFVSNMTFLFTEPKVEDQENGTKECIPEKKRPELDTSVDNLTPEPMEIQNDTETEMWYGHIKPRLNIQEPVPISECKKPAKFYCW